MASDPTTGSPEMTAPEAPVVRKRSWGDAYTWMLILSFLFLCLGCLFLFIEWSQYARQIKPSGF